MLTLKIKLADPTMRIEYPRHLFSPLRKAVIEGDGVFEVPASSFWHRRIREGTFVRVTETKPAKQPDKPKAKTKETKGEE